MESKQPYETGITIFGNSITILSVDCLSLPKISHNNENHEILHSSQPWQEMTKELGSATDRVKYTCPWCHFNFEIRWFPGMSVGEILTKATKNISSQSHD